MNFLAEFSGVVEHGDAYGRRLGYPTANIDTRDYYARNLNVALGVYAGHVLLLDGRRFLAGIVISVELRAEILRGARSGSAAADDDAKLSTEVRNKNVKIEAHLLDFSGDLYGQRVVFQVVKFLRPYMHFDSEVELVEQIGRDIDQIKSLKLKIKS